MRGRRGVCICTWRKFRGRCLSGRRRHTPTTEGGGSGVVVRLKRNLHCFKRGFYGEFIPDSSAAKRGGSGRGCEKPRSDGIPNELQIANSQGVWRRSRHARGEKRETRACLRHTSCEPVYDLLTVSRHRRKNVASPGWCAEAHPMADFGCRGGGAACVGWGLPHRRTTMPGAVYGGFGRCLYPSTESLIRVASPDRAP